MKKRDGKIDFKSLSWPLQLAVIAILIEFGYQLLAFIIGFYTGWKM